CRQVAGSSSVERSGSRQQLLSARRCSGGLFFCTADCLAYNLPRRSLTFSDRGTIDDEIAEWHSTSCLRAAANPCRAYLLLSWRAEIVRRPCVDPRTLDADSRHYRVCRRPADHAGSVHASRCARCLRRDGSSVLQVPQSWWLIPLHRPR